MSDDLYEKMSDFYKLEKKYYKNIAKMKKKISENTELSQKQKREKFESLRPKCINCKKPVGTIFEVKRNSLRAICGANNPNIAKEGYKPCDLNIKIIKPEIVNLEEIISKTREEKDNIMEKITLDKIKLLYSSSSSNDQLETVEKIEKMKIEYREKNTVLENYIKQHLDLVENKDTKKELFLKTYSVIKEINELIKNKKTKEAVELYIDSYIPAIREETNNKYQIKYIDQVGDEFYLQEVTKDENIFNLDVIESKKQELQT